MVCGYVTMLNDQLIMITNTLVWVSVKRVLGSCVPTSPGGSSAYDM